MSFKESYYRERKRIQRYISYRKGLGFLTEFKLPKIPKRITAGSVRALQKFTPKFLREKETAYVSRETGEVVESSEHYKLTKAYNEEKKEANVKKQKKKVKKAPTRTEVVIGNFLADASEFPNSAYPIIKKFLDELRKDYTDEEIAEMLEESAAAGRRLTWEIAYKAEALLHWLDETFPGHAILMSEMEDFVFEHDFYEYEYG